ncbi:MAG: flavodoxin [Candidatus Azobacteroides sp.]|nr:flavodoxin [Candidatus Azobacteroides sp.]
MKTTSLVVTIIIMLVGNGMKTQAQSAGNGKKILIAYYSLRNGNTRIVAEHIQKNTGGDIFRIETVNTYPAEYRAVTEQAKKELETGYRPALKNNIPDFGQYDIIYLGSPNWWNTIAPAVFIFLESYNFKGKTIVPFITHEGSRLGASVSDIRKLVPEATVLQGLPIRGSAVADAMPDVQKWLKDLEMIK